MRWGLRPCSAQLTGQDWLVLQALPTMSVLLDRLVRVVGTLYPIGLLLLLPPLLLLLLLPLVVVAVAKLAGAKIELW